MNIKLTTKEKVIIGTLEVITIGTGLILAFGYAFNILKVSNVIPV